MTEYKTLRVPSDAWEAARESKRESETWGEFLQRCSSNPPEVREFVESDDADRPVTLEATEYTKIAEEIEARLR